MSDIIEKGIQVAEQITTVLQPVIDTNTWMASCPFCTASKSGADLMSELTHEDDCAYVLALEIMVAT